MKFLDLAKVFIRSGSGGAGAISFRREKFIEYGGPDGGDGGRGGSVWAQAADGLNTLIDFRYQQHFFAENGKSGMGKQRSGASGGDKILVVPVGTEILDEDKETIIADLTEIGQRVLLGALPQHLRRQSALVALQRRKRIFDSHSSAVHFGALWCGRCRCPLTIEHPP